MIKFSVLKNPTEEARRAINRLTPQLTSNGGMTSKKELAAIVRDPNNTVLLVWEKKELIGIGMLVLLRTPLKLRARIECVVVDEKHRHRGIGTHIIKALVKIAKKKKAINILLNAGSSTATPKERAEVEGFYKGLDFHPTTLHTFRLDIR